MYCFKKIAESLFYKKVIEGSFSGQASNSRDFICVNDTSIHLYSVINKNIEIVSKYDVNCIIKSAEIYKNQKDEDYILLTTIADSLLMLGYNKANYQFQILAHFCFSHVNDKQPPIHQIGKHICVLGDKQKVIMLGAYMKNILVLEYLNGIFIQRSIISLPNDNIHKILASDEKNTQIDNFNILASELDSPESLKIRIVHVKLNSTDLSLQEKKDMIHVPNVKNQERQIEVPIDCVIFTDKQGHQNFLILTSLQIVNIKLNRETTRYKEESTQLKNLFQKDRKQIQPLSIKEFKQIKYILLNDGKCFYFDSFQDNLQEIKKQGFKTLFYADQNEFEIIDALPPNIQNSEWISVSDKNICLVQAEQSSCSIISFQPTFSSVINSAIDHRNRNIYSIINGAIHYLRKVFKGYDAKDLQLVSLNVPSQIKHSFVNQKDIESNKKQFNIYLSSQNESFVLQVQQLEGIQNFKLSLINSFIDPIQKNEIIKNISFQENGRVLMVLNSKIILLDEQSKKIINEQPIQNDQKQSEQVVKSTILDNSWIFVLTQSNKVYAYKQDFINFKQYAVPSIIQEGEIIQNQNDQLNQVQEKGQADKQDQYISQNPHQNIHSKQVNNFMHKQISTLYTYKQNDEILLVVGYYNETIKIIKILLENSNLNMKTVQHFYSLNVLNDVLFYNNQETQGLIFSFRGGIVQDLIQLDYSRDIKDQEEKVKTLHLDERDSAKILRFDNKIYLQSSHTVYFYKQYSTNREALQLVLNGNKHFLNNPIINLMCPFAKDKFILISQDKCFSFRQQANLQQEKTEFKQIQIPLKTDDKIISQKLQLNNINNSQKQIMNIYFFKRIIFNRELDSFIIIDQMGCIYIVSRDGYILQTINDLPSLYPMMKVANMKKVMLSDHDQYIFIATEKHGALLIQLQFSQNKVIQNKLNMNQNQCKRISKIIVINQFILQNQQQQDIYFVSDITYMSVLNMLFICGQNVIFCYQLQKQIESTQEEEKFQFNKISQLILPQQKQIICLDSINNLILIGDLKDSVLLYNIQNKFEGGKHFFQWNLEKTEFNQRALKESIFVDKSNLIGLDKYGEIFGSVTDQKVYHDANFNLHNFSLMNIRETGQIVKFHSYIQAKKHFHQQEDKNQLQDLDSHKLLPKLHNLNRSTILYICGIGGSIYQVVYCDLLFNFDVEKYNSYILILENILRQLKSNQFSQKKNSLDIMRKTRKFGNSQRFVDINLFESLNKQEFNQIIQDLQNQIPKEEVRQLNVEDLKKVFQYIFSLFMN